MTQNSLVRVLHVLAALLLFIALARPAYADAPRLEWDPSSEPNIAGYRVYDGESSRNYSHVVDVGLETSVELTDLSAGITHYFAVTAYDVDQTESPFSDEVAYTAPVDGINSAIIPIGLTRWADAVGIQFNGRAGQQCRIVASTDLIEWHPIHSITVPKNGTLFYTDDGAELNAMRFYRVVATPP
jgi:hypothetical protein